MCTNQAIRIRLMNVLKPYILRINNTRIIAIMSVFIHNYVCWIIYYLWQIEAGQSDAGIGMTMPKSYI